jgi:hypothetical protein
MSKKFPRPLQLVSADRSGQLVLHGEGEAFLRNLAGPFAVVVVTGKYRTGKSFLLNRCVLGLHGSRGFATSALTTSCTRGLLLYPQLLQRGERRVLVLDSEGTASMEASANHDAKLIAVALLLSSVLVVNSVGAIDETALSSLGLVANVAESMADERWDRPALLWALRDLALELSGREGETLEPDEYLEHVLSSSMHAESEGKRDVRQQIREIFGVRRLQPFVRPATDESKLQTLSAVPDTELRPEFLEQRRSFERVLDELVCSPKTLGGEPVDGNALLTLLNAVLSAVNAGAVPDVVDAFESLLVSKLADWLATTKSQLRAAAEELRLTLPTSPERLHLDLPQQPRSLERAGGRAEAARLELERFLSEILERVLAANSEKAESWFSTRLASCSNLEDLNQLLRDSSARLGAFLTLELLPRLLTPHIFESWHGDRVKREMSSELAASEERRRRTEERAELAEQEAVELRNHLERVTDDLTKHLRSDDETWRARTESGEQEELRQELRRALEEASDTRAASQSLRLGIQQQEDVIGSLTNAQNQIRGELEEVRRELTSEREQRTEASVDFSRSRTDFDEAVTALRRSLLTEVHEASARASSEMRLVTTENRELSAERDEVRALLLRTQASAEELSVALESEKILSEERERANASELHALRMESARRLAEKVESMTKSVKETQVELNRARGQILDTERRAMRLEFVNEDLKRKAGEVETLQLSSRKSQRTAEELHEQLRHSTATSEYSRAVCDELRSQLKESDRSNREALQQLRSTLLEQQLQNAKLEAELSLHRGFSQNLRM